MTKILTFENQTYTDAETLTHDNRTLNVIIIFSCNLFYMKYHC